MKRFAFTLLELVFVIIVIGILAVLAMPNFNRNPLVEAAEQVAGHIRYTQHLAMVDDKFDPNDQLWFRENWQIEFKSATNVYYEIYSDIDHLGNSDSTTHKEEATDPLTGDSLDGNSDITDLKKKYAIESVTFSANCRGNGTGKELAFDALGRPYYYITSANPPVTNMSQYLLTSDCNITLVHPTEGNAIITVRPETGYVSVSYN
jgi:prepilin-type N-terminal cleavage/methylation domain-containing protein